MAEKKKLESIVVGPYGSAYAWLSKPDEGQKFSDGKYKVTLLIPKDDEDAVEAIKAKCDVAAEAEWGPKVKGVKYPLADGDDKDKEEFHGFWLLTAKSKFQPGFVDAKRVELEDGVFPRSGDLLRVSGNLFPYISSGKKGVSVQMRNVQLVEKRNGGGNAADDFDELDGYDGLSSQADANEDF